MSLTDKSFNETYRQSLSSNDLYNIELATNFIKQSSFYNTSLDNTNAFNPNKKQYEDRYVYLDSFANNREFYDKNLKVDTHYLDNTLSFLGGVGTGAKNLLVDTATGLYRLATDPVETAKGIANTISNADTLIYNGFMKSELDAVLGDYESVTARDLEIIAGLTGPGAVTNKAGKAALDRVGKKPSEVTSDVTKIDKPTSNTNIKHNGNSGNDGVGKNDIQKLNNNDNTMIATSKGVVVSSNTLAKQGSSNLVGDFTKLEGATVDEIISRVPKDWKMLAQKNGNGIRFIDEAGIERIRIHGPDPKAPIGTNSNSGWILRIQDKNKNYLDNFGNIGGYKANETHIPIYGNPILEK